MIDLSTITWNPYRFDNSTIADLSPHWSIAVMKFDRGYFWDLIHYDDQGRASVPLSSISVWDKSIYYPTAGEAQEAAKAWIIANRVMGETPKSNKRVLSFEIGNSLANNDWFRKTLITAFPEFVIDVRVPNPQPIPDIGESGIFADPSRLKMTIFISAREPNGREPTDADQQRAVDILMED